MLDSNYESCSCSIKCEYLWGGASSGEGGGGDKIVGRSKVRPLIKGSCSSSLILGIVSPSARASREDLLTKVECFAERLIG